MKLKVYSIFSKFVKENADNGVEVFVNKSGHELSPELKEEISDFIYENLMEGLADIVDWDDQEEVPERPYSLEESSQMYIDRESTPTYYATANSTIFPLTQSPQSTITGAVIDGGLREEAERMSGVFTGVDRGRVRSASRERLQRDLDNGFDPLYSRSEVRDSVPLRREGGTSIPEDPIEGWDRSRLSTATECSTMPPPI
jgi:hypothetical protein